jgi:hypothetical protein
MKGVVHDFPGQQVNTPEAHSSMTKFVSDHCDISRVATTTPIELVTSHLAASAVCNLSSEEMMAIEKTAGGLLSMCDCMHVEEPCRVRTLAEANHESSASRECGALPARERQNLVALCAPRCINKL